jgi:hypothetical protein
MRTQYFGPALAKNLTIQGFQYGMGIDRPGSVELETLRLFSAPANARKLIHRWRDTATVAGRAGIVRTDAEGGR